MDYKYEMVLHKAQRTIFNDPKRFRVCVSGRRFGKSNMLLQCIIHRTLSFKGVVSVLSPETTLVVMPTAVQVRQILFKPLCKLILETDLKYLLEPKGINQSTMVIRFRGKPAIKFAGGNDRGGDGCRGIRIYALFLDETQDLLPVVWSEVLRPAMSDTQDQNHFPFFLSQAVMPNLN